MDAQLDRTESLACTPETTSMFFRLPPDNEMRGRLLLYAASMLSEIDVYQFEYEQFQRDVHILIAGTLSAAIQFLHDEAKTELAKIENWLKKPTSDEYQEHLVDEHVDVLATNDTQERFLRNMALVALASRLTHSLHNMARSAEAFSERKKGYRPKKGYQKRGMSEFAGLWAEYKERFGIDLIDEHASRVAFVEPLREVRNQIVHDGGEANTLKRLDESEINGDESGWLDLDFSRKYPQYVQGEGIGAEVNVSQELLDKNIEASIELVGWLAGELRRREVASTKNITEIQ
jgi:hypothetical protein